MKQITKPLPKWVGLASATLVAVSAVSHDKLVTAIGERPAAILIIVAAIVAANSHSLGGKGGKSDEPA